MNPSKCAFGVSSWKVLGFLFHQRGIDLDSTEAKAIAALTPPITSKELRSFVGKVSYLRRFIPSLVKILKLLVKKTKKGVTFVWCDQCEGAFKKIQAILADPHTMVAPSRGKPLFFIHSQHGAIVRNIINSRTKGSGETSILHWQAHEGTKVEILND